MGDIMRLARSVSLLLAGATTVMLPGTTLIPGVIEAHSHMCLHMTDGVIYKRP